MNVVISSQYCLSCMVQILVFASSFRCIFLFSSELQGSCLWLPLAGITSMPRHAWLFMWAQGWKLDLHAGVASTLQSEPTQTQGYLFLRLKRSMDDSEVIGHWHVYRPLLTNVINVLGLKTQSRFCDTNSITVLMGDGRCMWLYIIVYLYEILKKNSLKIKT